MDAVFFYLFLFFLCVLIIFYLTIVKPKKREETARVKAEELDKQIQELSQRVLFVTSSTVPGKEIKRVIGAVTGVSKTEASTDAEFKLAEKEALLDIMQKAIELGANAIVDLKMTTGSYEKRVWIDIGSQKGYRMVSKVTYTGTAVIV